MWIRYTLARALLVLTLLSFTSIWLAEAKALDGEVGHVRRIPQDPQPDSTTERDATSTTRKPTPTLRQEEEDMPRTSVVTMTQDAKETDAPIHLTSVEADGSNEREQEQVYKGGVPIVPIVTPGVGVAGVLLMIAGLAYGLVGIKIKRLHIFLSSTFLSALGITVLIVYVMNPPVKDAIQGGYVVAAVMTGVIVGAIAIVFPEVTENLGCLLGGFCVAMWFLILKPGGLITETYGKIIMIAACSLAVFSLGFHRITKPYALIFSLSFSGSTGVILGIDCYSKAGLKEFWLYIWALNDKLFPLGTNDYPHTRGIRVEIAGIILIFALGVMSQVKLWKILKDRRAVRDQAKRQEEADLEAIDEETGRRVEEQHQTERAEWEAKYNPTDPEKKEPTETTVAIPLSRDGSKTDSGIGDLQTAECSTEKLEESQATQEVHEEQPSEVRETRVIGESTDAAPNTDRQTIPVGTDFVAPVDDQEVQDTPRCPEQSQPVEDQAAKEEAERQARRAQVPPTPDVIPLPLPIMVPEEDNDANSSDRSSIAARAESPELEEEIEDTHGPVVGTLSRTTSHQSLESLDIPMNEDRASSLAATCDIDEPEDLENMSVSPEAEVLEDEVESADGVEAASGGTETPKADPVDTTPLVGVAETGSESGRTKETEKRDTVESSMVAPSTEPAKDPIAERKTKRSARRSLVSQSASQRASSAVSSGNLPVGLPQDLAPSSFPKSASASSVTRSSKAEIQTHCSKIVKTYRTNEWAKHLSEAEKPELDDLDRQEIPGGNEQKAALLDVLALQETAEVIPAAPVPAKTEVPARKLSTPGISKMEQAYRSPPPAATPVSASPASYRTATPEAYSTPPNRSSAITDFASPNRSSRQNTPSTLLGQRESMVRSRSSLSMYMTPGDGSRLSNQSLQSPPPAASRSASALGNRSMTPAPYNPISYTFQPPQAPQPLETIDDDNMLLSTRRELLSRQSARSPPEPIARLRPAPQISPPRQQAIQEDRMKNWRESIKAEQDAQTRSQVVERRRSELLDQKVREINASKAQQARPQSGFTDDETDLGRRMRQADMLKLHEEAMHKMQASANRRL